MAQSGEREYGLDALRVFAFAVLILFHSGMGYVTWGWHVKNPQQSTALEQWMRFPHLWRLALLFFISGAGAAFSLRKRTFWQFAGERTRRLLLPLGVGMFLIVPPQIYLERLQQGQVFDSYFAFWRTVFDMRPYPAGNTSWHHLWFVAYIWVYALASIPLLRWLRGESGRRTLAALAGWAERHWAVLYLINLPNLAVALTLGPHWPATNNLISDWANLTGAWLTFLWGFVFASERRLLDAVTRRRREFFVLGVALTVAYYALRAAGIRPGTVLETYLGLAWIFALLGYARTWVRSGSPFLRYATEAVYPFYIVHQTITVALVYWMLAWPVGIAPKLAVAATGTFTGSWIIFELVRRVRLLRPLFGLRPLR